MCCAAPCEIGRNGSGTRTQYSCRAIAAQTTVVRLGPNLDVTHAAGRWQVCEMKGIAARKPTNIVPPPKNSAHAARTDPWVNAVMISAKNASVVDRFNDVR